MGKVGGLCFDFVLYYPKYVPQVLRISNNTLYPCLCGVVRGELDTLLASFPSIYVCLYEAVVYFH